MAKSTASHMTIEKWFFLLITGVVIYLFWQILQPFVLVVLLASITAVILAPVDRKLTKLVRYPKLSAALISVGIFTLVFIPLLITLYLMVTQASELIQSATADTAWLDQLRSAADPLLAAFPEPVRAELTNVNVAELGQSAALWAIDNVGAVFSSTTALIINAFIFFLCLYYVLVDRDKIYAEALAISPMNDKIDASLVKRIVKTIRSVVFGVLVLAVVQGVLAGIGMTIFGVPGSLIWGALTILAAMVPFVGTGLVLIPAIVYLFVTGSTTAGIGLLIWAVVFVSFSDNIIGPYLIGGTTHMHNLLVLIAVLGGLNAFGPLGGVAGPIILAALLALIELYKSGILTTGKMQNA